MLISLSRRVFRVEKAKVLLTIPDTFNISGTLFTESSQTFILCVFSEHTLYICHNRAPSKGFPGRDRDR